MEEREKHPGAVELGRLRKARLSVDQRKEEARHAALVRWRKKGLKKKTRKDDTTT